MAEPLGQYFKRAREGKGWTLEQAAAKTRILPQYLEAVEQDNYERLPEEVFARGFVRSYARMLGLDETEVLQKFHETGGQFYAKRTEREQLRLQIREEERRKKTNHMIVAGMIGVALIALLVATGHDRGRVRPTAESLREPSLPPRNEVPVNAPPKSELMPHPDQPMRAQPARPDAIVREATPPESHEPGPPMPREPHSPAPQLPAPAAVERPVAPELPLVATVSDHKKLVLEVEAVERSWVMVRTDQNPAQDVLLAPGERVRWSAEDKLTLTLGNAGGVRVLINGKPQGPYGTSGKVVKDLIFQR